MIEEHYGIEELNVEIKKLDRLATILLSLIIVGMFAIALLIFIYHWG
jgi:hypothetical protein